MMRCATGLVTLAMALSTAETTAAGAGLDPDVVGFDQEASGASNELRTKVATLKSQNLAQGAALSTVKAAVPAKQLARIMTAAVVERCPGDTPASVLTHNEADRCTSSGSLGEIAKEDREGLGEAGRHGNGATRRRRYATGRPKVAVQWAPFDWTQCKSEVWSSPSLSLPILPSPHHSVCRTIPCRMWFFTLAGRCCSTSHRRVDP